MSMNKERFVRCISPVKPGRFRDAWSIRQARAVAQKVYLQFKLRMEMRARCSALSLHATSVLGAMPSGQTSPAASTGLSAEAIASLRRDVYGLKE